MATQASDTRTPQEQPHPLLGHRCRVKGKHDTTGKVQRVVRTPDGLLLYIEGDDKIAYAIEDVIQED